MSEASDSQNLKAFLTTIAISEGTEGVGYHGYDCIVGSTSACPHLFKTYADHPRILVQVRPGLSSTAAGRYQILARYYDAYKKTLKLKDFAPASQDMIAIRMIREQFALADVKAGRLESAVKKCSNIWASFPGAGYNQHQNTMEQMKQWFVNSGGVPS